MNRQILITALLMALISSACAMQSQKNPPLVLEPNKYSYTFAVPAGWDFSFEQAQQFGVRLLYFPTGGNFNDSDSTIYVNEICSMNCDDKLSTAIQTIIDNAKNYSPNLQVMDAVPIKLPATGEAPVIIFTGSKDPRQAKEALAFLKHDETIILIVLTTKDTKNWTQDYKAFEAIVAGHKFFNCNSPNLKVPCR